MGETDPAGFDAEALVRGNVAIVACGMALVPWVVSTCRYARLQRLVCCSHCAVHTSTGISSDVLEVRVRGWNTARGLMVQVAPLDRLAREGVVKQGCCLKFRGAGMGACVGCWGGVEGSTESLLEIGVE